MRPLERFCWQSWQRLQSEAALVPVACTARLRLLLKPALSRSQIPLISIRMRLTWLRNSSSSSSTFEGSINSSKMHSHRMQSLLPVGLPPPAPDLLTSLKPCALPEDMPLPVSSSKAAAAAAAAAGDDDDDAAGFDWKGLARASPQQQKQQKQQQQKQRHLKGSAEALAAASRKIAIVTGAVAPSPPSTSAQARQTRPAPAAPAEPEGPIDGTDVLGRKRNFWTFCPNPERNRNLHLCLPRATDRSLSSARFNLTSREKWGKRKWSLSRHPGCNREGMSMRVERVPLPRVKAKLQAARRELAVETEGAEAVKVETGSKGPFAAAAGGAAAGGTEAEDEFDRVKRRIEELQREQELKKQRKKEKKRKAAAATTGADASAAAANDNLAAANPEAAALAAMGLPTSFSGC
ncbi:hypothetical protein ACSSS7_003148 [Eimeria intestinalis]